LERVEELLQVFDIQTSTENFYAGDVLVHNCYVDNGSRGYRSTGLATANPKYPEFMRKKMEQMYIAPPAYMSSFTEPFQLLEKTYHVVQRLTQVFVDNGSPFFYLSRTIPPDWAVDLLQSNPYNYMQWSVNDSRTKVYKAISPGSYTIEQVLEAVADLTSKGIYTSFQCNPVLPGITPIEAIVDLIHLGAEAGLKHIIFKFAEQVFNQRQMLMNRLISGRVPNVDKFDAVFHQTIGGVYTVNQDVRVEWLNVFLEETRKAGITMSTCYEYFDNGKAGENMAPYFTTSDQCHGRGVPMFYRTDLSEKFKPLPGCFRKGCLYCEEYGTHACHNETLLQAKMLTYKDYKTIQLDGDPRNWKLNDSCQPPSKVGESRGANFNLYTDMELWSK
jgi:DNA repair photolyase